MSNVVKVTQGSRSLAKVITISLYMR
ncbi:hypothetical protein QIA12_05090 (plasmid) [Borreliella burgdorferi]